MRASQQQTTTDQLEGRSSFMPQPGFNAVSCRRSVSIGESGLERFVPNGQSVNFSVSGFHPNFIFLNLRLLYVAKRDPSNWAPQRDLHGGTQVAAAVNPTESALFTCQLLPDSLALGRLREIRLFGAHVARS